MQVSNLTQESGFKLSIFATPPSFGRGSPFKFQSLLCPMGMQVSSQTQESGLKLSTFSTSPGFGRGSLSLQGFNLSFQVVLLSKLPIPNVSRPLVFSIIISGIFVQIVFVVFREYIFDFFSSSASMTISTLRPIQSIATMMSMRI
jgi:hypothetical protein